MNISELFGTVFEPQLLQEIESKATFITAREGDTIIRAGQMIRHMPLLLSGTLKISRVEPDGRELFLYYISSKESCAMTFTCCTQQTRSEVNAVAEEDVTFLAIPVDVMDRWMATYPSWKRFVMTTIQMRFNELLRAIDQIAFQKLDERLVNYLKEKSKATGSSLVNLSHEQIATDLASSREVISRLLKRLELDGKLLLYRHQIKLLREL